MLPLAEKRRQKFTLVLFLSFHPAVPPCMPSACHHAAQWHRANDVIISSNLSAGPLDPWACAGDTLVMMCGVQLWTWQNSLMPRCLRMSKCCKTREILMIDIWTAWKYCRYLCVAFVLTPASSFKGKWLHNLQPKKSKHSWWCIAGLKHNTLALDVADMTRRSWPDLM